MKLQSGKQSPVYSLKIVEGEEKERSASWCSVCVNS